MIKVSIFCTLANKKPPSQIIVMGVFKFILTHLASQRCQTRIDVLRYEYNSVGINKSPKAYEAYEGSPKKSS